MKVIRGGTQNTTVCGEFFRYINFFKIIPDVGNDSNLLIVFYVQIVPDDFVIDRKSVV